jgi:hypothetical protein
MIFLEILKQDPGNSFVQGRRQPMSRLNLKANQMNGFSSLYSVVDPARIEFGSRSDGIRPFVSATRSPADSMQFVVLNRFADRACQKEKAHFCEPKASEVISKPAKASHYFQKISVSMSLVTLALGFWLMGLLSFIQDPFGGGSFETNTTASILGGIAGIAAGSVFSVYSVAYWLRGKSHRRLDL